MTSPLVTQAMIDAYYEYTHLTLDRRKFVTQLRAMAEPDITKTPFYPLRDMSNMRRDGEVNLQQ